MQTVEKVIHNLTREQKERLANIRTERARRTFLSFNKCVDDKYDDPDHVAILCDALDQVEQGKIKHLIVCMPPRHGKSETVSRKFPAYALGKDPSRRIIMSSYGFELSKGFSRRCRDLIESRRYQAIFGIQTADDARAVNDWNIVDCEGINRGGSLTAVGVGGATTGRGADIFIIDDPIKNYQEADSETYREMTWDWYRSVALTRLEPNAALIIILTRWHRDDLVGRIIKHHLEEEDDLKDEWHIINFPAMYENDVDQQFEAFFKDPKVHVYQNPIGRKVGDPLWPERYGKKDLEKKKSKSGSRIWNALYQQRPQDPATQLCRREWIQWYDRLPEKDVDVRRFGGIDTATSKKTQGDNMSMVDLCVDFGGFLYVDDVFLDKVSNKSFSAHVCNQHKIKNYLKIKIESNKDGESIRQRIEEEGMDPDNEYVVPPIYAAQTANDKVVCFMAYQHLIETGVMKFKRGNPKVAQLVEHLCSFDGLGGDVDDDVDALSRAYEAYATHKGAVVHAADADYDPTSLD